MPIYRCIAVSFWTDRKILRKFSPEDKYFFLYLLTNDKTEITGCYELKIEDAADDLGYTIETLMGLFKRMESYHDVIRTRMLDSERIEVLVLNWNKYNWNGSDKQLRGVEIGAEKIHTPEFKKYVLENLELKRQEVAKKNAPQTTAEEGEPVRKRWETIRIGNSIEGRPTIEEVDQYVKEKGYQVHARAFWFYYETRGWKDGNGMPIRDWKKCLDACEENETFRGVI